MEQTLSESSIIRAFAMETCERITRKTMLVLQKMDYCLMAGDDSGLSSTWEELCVQIQGQESTYWDAYEQTIRDIMAAEFGKLSARRMPYGFKPTKGKAGAAKTKTIEMQR